MCIYYFNYRLMIVIISTNGVLTLHCSQCRSLSRLRFSCRPKGAVMLFTGTFFQLIHTFVLPPSPQVQDAVRCRMGGCKDDSENSPDSCKNGQVQIMVNSISFHSAFQFHPAQSRPLGPPGPGSGRKSACPNSCSVSLHGLDCLD